MLRVSTLPRQAAVRACRSCAVLQRSFASEANHAGHSNSTVYDSPSAEAYPAEPDMADGASAASAASAPHAFKGASAERRRRLRELSSPVYAPDMERKNLIDRIVRVDHSGEYSAVQIYRGQLAVLQGTAEYPLIEHMKQQEQVHLDKLNDLIVNRRVRPSALLPLWHMAGYALGAGTALLGKEAAMACTVAVETAIGGHYNNQIREVLAKGYDEQELLDIIKQNRDEELEHLDTGLEHNAEQAPFYQALSAVVQAGCKAAVWVTERV